MPPLILPDFECLPSSALVPPGLPLPPLFWNHLIPLTSAFRQPLCLSLRGRLGPPALRLHLRLYHHRLCHHQSSPWSRQGNPRHGSSLLRHRCGVSPWLDAGVPPSSCSGLLPGSSHHLHHPGFTSHLSCPRWDCQREVAPFREGAYCHSYVQFDFVFWLCFLPACQFRYQFLWLLI